MAQLVAVFNIPIIKHLERDEISLFPAAAWLRHKMLPFQTEGGTSIAEPEVSLG